MAEELSEQGAQVESDLGKVTLDSLSDADLQLVNALASAWDTLGWVHFQAAEMERAQNYIPECRYRRSCRAAI
jgi:hypothetical protein